MEEERRQKYQMQQQLQVKKQQLKEEVEREKQLQKERERQKDYERKQRAHQTKDKLKAYQEQLKHAQDMQIKQNQAIAAQFEQIKLEQERADMAHASDDSDDDDPFGQASPTPNNIAPTPFTQKKSVKANTRSVTSMNKSLVNTLFDGGSVVQGSIRSPVRI